MKIYSIFLNSLLLQLITTLTFAQTFDFEADVTKGCAPLTVTLTDLSGEVGADIKYSFFEGQPFGDLNTFTYNAPGIYTVVQLIQTDGAASAIEKEDYIEVVAPQEPEFEVVNCAGFGVRVNVTDTLYDFIELDFGDGSAPVMLQQNEILIYNYADATERIITAQGGFTNGGNISCGTNSVSFTPQQAINPAFIAVAQVVNDTDIELTFNIFPEVDYILEEQIGNGGFIEIGVLDQGQTSLVLTNRDAIQQSHCYRIVANEICTGTLVVSNVICVGDLTLTDALGVNQIEWPEFTNTTDFEEFRIIINSVVEEVITTPRTTVYNHRDVTCNVEYCYQLELQYSNGAVSRSSQQCLIASSNTTPPTAENLKVTVDGENVALTFDMPVGIENIRTVNIQRSTNGGDFTSVRNEDTMANSLIDTDVNVNENSYCYQIVVQDSCNNLSPTSLKVCTVLLSARREETGNVLNWTPFEGFPFGFSYTIEVLDENGDVVRTVENLPRATNTFIDNEATDPAAIYKYRIKTVADHSATEVAFSNEVVVIGVLKLQAPEAFTPNGDGLNDSFYVRGNLIDTYLLRVFNRWGDLIFISKLQEQGWDGSINNEEAPAGTYSFILEAKDINGNTASLKGMFLLIR